MKNQSDNNSQEQFGESQIRFQFFSAFQRILQTKIIFECIQPSLEQQEFCFITYLRVNPQKIPIYCQLKLNNNRLTLKYQPFINKKPLKALSQTQKVTLSKYLINKKNLPYTIAHPQTGQISFQYSYCVFEIKDSFAQDLASYLMQNIKQIKDDLFKISQILNFPMFDEHISQKSSSKIQYYLSRFRMTKLSYCKLNNPNSIRNEQSIYVGVKEDPMVKMMKQYLVDQQLNDFTVSKKEREMIFTEFNIARAKNKNSSKNQERYSDDEQKNQKIKKLIFESDMDNNFLPIPKAGMSSFISINKYLAKNRKCITFQNKLIFLKGIMAILYELWQKFVFPVLDISELIVGDDLVVRINNLDKARFYTPSQRNKAKSEQQIFLKKVETLISFAQIYHLIIFGTKLIHTKRHNNQSYLELHKKNHIFDNIVIENSTINSHLYGPKNLILILNGIFFNFLPNSGQFQKKEYQIPNLNYLYRALVSLIQRQIKSKQKNINKVPR